MEGDDVTGVSVDADILFQSTPSGWRETAIKTKTTHATLSISIHSLRVEGDGVTVHWRKTGLVISIHSLRVEGDWPPCNSTVTYCRFQSTPSGWRETLLIFRVFKIKAISIHSLRVEGDLRSYQNILTQNHFNPLPPGGGRPRLPMSTPLTPEISIHSLRVEGDGGLSGSNAFYCGFQSTPSGWRETVLRQRCKKAIKFQSTPSGWRETTLADVNPSYPGDFNPLPPGGGRQHSVCGFTRPLCISIHSLRVEGDEMLML